MPFVKGKSGNPAGVPKAARQANRMVKNALIAYADGDRKALPALAARVWKDALESPEFERQRWATEFIADRIDGKPAQAIVGGDESEGDQPIQVAGSLSPAAEAMLAAAMTGIKKAQDEKA